MTEADDRTAATKQAPATPQTPDQDEEHLRILSVFHYVLAGIAFLVGCLPFFHLAFGMALATGTLGGGAGGDEALVGCFVMAAAGIFILLAWGYAAALVLAGKFLGEHRHHTFCLVVAGISCIFMPLGTVLGIFTILVLVRPSVKGRFDAPSRPAPE